MIKNKAKTLLLLAIFSGSFFFAEPWAANPCPEEEHFDVLCNEICDKVNGVWGCHADSNNLDRCCIEGVGSCGEQSECPECGDGGSCGF